jgi:hypothetical protein
MPMTPHRELEATMDVQYEAGTCSGIAYTCRRLMEDFGNDPAVVAWAERILLDTDERMSQVEAFLDILDESDFD